MQTTTLLLLFAAAIVALALALFQYYFKTKRKGKLSILLSFLRFLAFFGLFLLIINPKFSKNEYTIQKTNLVLLTDNSTSMAASTSQVASILKNLNNSEAISKRFNVKSYRFGNDLQELTDSSYFQDKSTTISKALSSIKDVYNNTNTAVVLLTDGNQTIGADYGFLGNTLKFPIYPVVMGDTTRYEDLRIDQINVNKYAFLKNKFPIEVFISYEGSTAVSSVLSITINGRTAYRETLKLSSDNSTKVVNTLLEATSVGVKTVSVSLQPLENERNTVNNQKQVAIEVVDEKTNIAIISDILHPDIGALTKSIESNEQRSVVLKKPNAIPNELDDIDVFFFYQPNPSYNKIYKYVQQKKASLFTITGEEVNSNFLNNIQKTFRINGSYPVQETFAVLNSGFSKFDISDFSLEEFPPLSNGAGIIGNTNGENLLQMKIMGTTMDSPLLFAHEGETGKELVLFGENIWKWRMQSFRNNQNFENFDQFISKLILYLSDSSSKSRLNIDYERIYDGSGDSKITATYFDEAFVFDSNANISLHIKGKETGFSKVIPMLLKNGYYEADLLGIPAGEYNFTVTVEKENRSKSGNLTILDFDVEQQFLSADYRKLEQLANGTNGALYFPSEMDSLMMKLSDSNRFAPTQKGTKNVVSLIDFRILMALIVAVLAIEWFIRKYNGLI